MLPANEENPVGPEQRRASDADRQRTAELLGEALAAGRLTVEEHEERLQAAFGSKTVGELAALVRDLPSSSARGAGPKRMSAVFSKVIRGGQMVLPPLIELRSTFGAAYLNLTNAEFADGGVDIDASATFGKIVITVPADAHVEDEGSAMFGKRSLPSSRPSRPTGPVVRIHGRSLFGKVSVWREGAKVSVYPPWTWES